MIDEHARMGAIAAAATRPAVAADPEVRRMNRRRQIYQVLQYGRYAFVALMLYMMLSPSKPGKRVSGTPPLGAVQI